MNKLTKERLEEIRDHYCIGKCGECDVSRELLDAIDALDAEIIEYSKELCTEQEEALKQHTRAENAESEIDQFREVMKEVQKTLDWLYVGLTGMFGCPGKSEQDEFYELSPEKVKNALDKVNSILENK